MGNALFSLEDEDADQIPFDYNLESPDADAQLNGGTAAPNCQPKHSMQAQDDSHHGVKHARSSDGASQDEDEGEEKKRQHLAAAANGNKKLSYVQMAKMGYQELVNAIIRPPRAEYKVQKVWERCIVMVENTH